MLVFKASSIRNHLDTQPGMEDVLNQGVPLGRLGKSQEVASSIFVASPRQSVSCEIAGNCAIWARDVGGGLLNHQMTVAGRARAWTLGRSGSGGGAEKFKARGHAFW